MINGTPITIVGNIGQDVTLRYTPSGNAVATLSVAVPQRRFNRQTNKSEDKGTTWYAVIAWRGLAENVAASVKRGQRVIVYGTLESRAWETGDGKSGTAWEITADAIGPDLAFAQTDTRRIVRDSSAIPDDPWAGDASEPTGDAPAATDSPAASPAASGPESAAQPSASPAASHGATRPAPARGRGSRSRTGPAATA